MATQPEALYQFKIHVKGISPMIWRRFLVRVDTTIAELHFILQLIMGWSDAHLNCFKIYGKDYGVYHSVGRPMPWPNVQRQSDERVLKSLHPRLNGAATAGSSPTSMTSQKTGNM